MSDLLAWDQLCLAQEIFLHPFLKILLFFEVPNAMG
jgi:hypothetical protein